MTKTSINLQDLRRKIYIKAKAENNWKFWGLYVHVCKLETLRESYNKAKEKNGAPGIDGVTFQDIEADGIGEFLLQIQEELVLREYLPTRNWKKEIPKGDGKYRTLEIPTVSANCTEVQYPFGECHNHTPVSSTMWPKL